MQLTADQLTRLFGLAPDVAARWATGLNAVCDKYQINTKLRLCHFLAQIGHESNGLSVLTENLNYSGEALVKIFGKYFPTIASTVNYARKPEKIANKVYASRMGNGNESSGEGWKYRGRGPIQLTGKSNYAAASKDAGIDFVANPDLLTRAEYGGWGAGWYWNSRNINAAADRDDAVAATKLVNGGTNGLDDRKARLAKAKTIIQ